MPHLFNTVQEFLQSDQQWGQVEPPELGGFRGEVRKSATEIGQLRELTEDDLKQGIKTDTLVIATLNNPKRPGNIYKMEIPPKRDRKVRGVHGRSRTVSHQLRVPLRPGLQHRQRVPARKTGSTRIPEGIQR